MTHPAPRLTPPAAGSIATRAATTVPTSYNEADGSFEIVWTTGAAVRRYDWSQGEFDETLSTDPGAVRLDRLNAGAPVLRAHDRFTLEGVIGSVVPGSARMANGQGIARIRLADTPDAADVVAKVLAGHVRNVSVGYTVHQYEPLATADGEPKQLRAVDWEPLEVSLVPIGADPATFIRSLGPAAVATPPAAPGAVTIAQIRKRVAACGLTDTVAADLMERHASSPFNNESLTAMLSHHFTSKDTAAPTLHRSGASVLNDPSETLRTRIGDAIFARMAGKAPEPHAREFMGAGLVGMASALLQSQGENVRWKSDAEILERAMHTTSDFKALLTTSGNRFLLETFATAESAIKRVARQRTAADFRTLTALKLGGAPTLDLVNEGGEVKNGTMFEASETYKLGTFAKIFGISRQAMINDDLGAFADPLRLMARGAAETVAETMVAQLVPNAVSGVNPFAGRLEIAVDPRLTGTSWRLFADPAQWPVLEYAYLDGGAGPQLSTREGWDVLGMEFRVVLDFGCGAVDHRGAYRNPGV